MRGWGKANCARDFGAASCRAKSGGGTASREPFAGGRQSWDLSTGQRGFCCLYHRNSSKKKLSRAFKKPQQPCGHLPCAGCAESLGGKGKVVSRPPRALTLGVPRGLAAFLVCFCPPGLARRVSVCHVQSQCVPAPIDLNPSRPRPRVTPSVAGRAAGRA